MKLDEGERKCMSMDGLERGSKRADRHVWTYVGI